LRLLFSFRKKRQGFEQGGSKRQLAEENSPVDCFCRRGNERKRGDRCGSTGTKSLQAGQNAHVRTLYVVKNVFAFEVIIPPEP